MVKKKEKKVDTPKNGTLKAMVRGAYDLQELRIMTGNRLVGNYKIKLDQLPGKKEHTMSEKAKKFLALLRSEYKKITDGYKIFPKAKDFKPYGNISEFTEFCLVEEYALAINHEEQHFKRLGELLIHYPLWDFFSGVPGVGPAMGGVILSEVDITQCKHASSLWKYAGVDVVLVEDGDSGEMVAEGRSKKKTHLVDREYEDKDGNMKWKKSITYNPFLKTKLLGVLGSSFLRIDGPKALKKNPDAIIYKTLYYNYKHRLETHRDHKDKAKGHIHKMAIRYMIKIFLIDVYVAWRTAEGLEVHKSYDEGQLGYKHGKINLRLAS